MKQSVKAAIVLTTSVITVPYAVAILANMLYGWPRKDKLRRSLHPRKVYSLNYALLQEIAKVRFIGLAIRWKYFYSTAENDRLVKDLPYGNNGNSLDLYHPRDDYDNPLSGNKPVVVFVYGGSWGSGDKSMYGLLCSQLADKLKAVVCCPNYSTYPKGYVDDMVQDMVDCLSWIQEHGEEFGGDKNKVMMIGHSAGGHLCVMSVLELTLKKLLHNPQAVLAFSDPSAMGLSRQSSIFSENINFEEKHFNGSNNSLNGTEADNNLPSISTTGSFYVVDDGNEKSFVVLNEGDDNKEKTPAVKTDEVSEDSKLEDSKDVTVEMSGGGSGDAGDQEEVLKVEVTEKGDTGQPVVPPVVISEDADMTQSQREARDILSSIKLVIGIAGVYHVGDHYDHESWRGVEDISYMAKAMYAPEHFDRLSPTVIVSELPDKILLPPLLLVHGDKDKIVPLSSTLRLGQALWEKGCLDVSIAVIPGCNHYDICLDLMDPQRSWYDSVMGEILKATSKCL